jgi:hypothetical protein
MLAREEGTGVPGVGTPVQEGRAAGPRTGPEGQRFFRSSMMIARMMITPFTISW